MSKLKLSEILDLLEQYRNSPNSTREGSKKLQTAVYTMFNKKDVSTSVARRFVLGAIKDLQI